MNILFMGTPEFARTVLASLVERGETVIAAVTQPDKPVGRKRVLTPPPVKAYALEQGIPVYQPTRLKDGAFAETLRELDPDLILVVAYGRILPNYILEYPKFGCVNIHASVLPRWRGAAPIQRALMAGDTESGVTVQYMAEGIDTGDVIAKIETPIPEDMDYGQLHDRLAEDGCKAIARVLEDIRRGTVCPCPQDDTKATYAAKIENEDCVLDFSCPAAQIHNQVRGLSWTQDSAPVGLAVTLLPDGRKLKVIKTQIANENTDAAPGTVLTADKTGIRVACGGDVIRILSVQPEGKKPMDAAAFVAGRGIAAGDVLMTPQL